jgi:hypothetical protein
LPFHKAKRLKIKSLALFSPFSAGHLFLSHKSITYVANPLFLAKNKHRPAASPKKMAKNNNFKQLFHTIADKIA